MSGENEVALQPWQKAVLDAIEYHAFGRGGERRSVFPWRHIDELGDVTHADDGSYRWTLKPGYERMRLFLVPLSSGEVETHHAYIDEGGDLCTPEGDSVGRAWYDAEYFLEIPELPG